MVLNRVNVKKQLLLVALLLVGIAGMAQPPAGYYDAIAGKMDKDVKTALFGIINQHTVRTYKELWTDLQTTDRRADGKVWDMYSNVTNFTFVDKQCGNYSKEGDCYNREHSLPNSWFGGDKQSPMYTDLFHMYPTDGFVNNMRGNNPFGEVGNVTKQSKGGYSKLGSCSFPGYSGIVFEPDDEYKGDFARTYFYMVTCYEDRVATWDSEMLSKDRYPAFSIWAIHLLLKWHRQDPVSQKEIDRNNVVYGIQNNRNPFIDYPVLAEFVWGDYMLEPVDMKGLTLYSNDYDVTSVAPATSQAPVVEAIYDISGRKVNVMTRGVYIITYRYADGSIRNVKKTIAHYGSED